MAAVSDCMFWLHCAVPKEDDEVAEVMAELRQTEAYYDRDSILHLNSTTFHSVTHDQQQTIMVLFYVTCEDHCLFLRMYSVSQKNLTPHPTPDVFLKFSLMTENF